MKLSLLNKEEEINYIIYNNRSFNLVSNFVNIDNIDIKLFREVESKYNFIKNISKNKEQSFIINNKDILENYNTDIIFDIDEFKDVYNKLFNYSAIDNIEVYKYLIDRGLKYDEILKYNISYISDNNIFSKRELDIIGYSIHPSLRKLFKEENVINSIVIPQNNNVIIRRLLNNEKHILKYSLSIPDITIFGIDNIEENSHINICEGFFDKIALERYLNNVVCVSSASWSSYQLYKLIYKKPKLVTIYSDYDYTGLKYSKINAKLLNMFGIKTNILCSKKFKDPSEHILENNLNMNEFDEIFVSDELLDLLYDNKYDDYIDFLKNKIIY